MWNVPGEYKVELIAFCKQNLVHDHMDHPVQLTYQVVKGVLVVVGGEHDLPEAAVARGQPDPQLVGGRPGHLRVLLEVEEDRAPPSRGPLLEVVRLRGCRGCGLRGRRGCVEVATLVNVRAVATLPVAEAHLDEDRLHFAAFPHHKLKVEAQFWR